MTSLRTPNRTPLKQAIAVLLAVLALKAAWLAIDHAIMPATIFAASIVMGRALVPVEQAVATWKQFVTVRDGYRQVSELLKRRTKVLRHVADVWLIWSVSFKDGDDKIVFAADACMR